MMTVMFGLYLLCASVCGMSLEARYDEMKPRNIKDTHHKERLDQIKYELVEKLGEGPRSNITRDQLPASLLEELRIKLQEPSPAPTFQDMVIFPDNGGNCMKTSEFGLCLTWRIPASVKNADTGVVAASMKIYKHVNHTGISRLTVSWNNSTVAVERPTLQSVSGWVNVDISQVVQAAEEDKEVNLWVSYPNKGVKVMTEMAYRPYITVATHSEIQPERKKRYAVMCDQRPKECCLQEWYVTFKELDMNWVIEPQGFYANYCTGNCLHDADFTKLMDNDDHSFVLYKTARKNWKVGSLRPCCSATQSASLRIFEIRNDNKLILRTLKDMRVEACGCF